MWFHACRSALLLSLVIVLSVAQAFAEDRTVALFSDDFSRFPEGPLSQPFAEVNPAVQEYHYFANRGTPLGPWGNAICYLDAWAGDRETGKPALKQILSPTDSKMMPQVFTPLFVTGEPEWTEYTVQADVQPLATSGHAGIALNYHTNRHHYVFWLQNGKEARLALRLPLEKQFREVQWKELGTIEFPYQTDRAYRLRVESRHGKLIASIDGKPVITAECGELLSGKAGLTADIPTRFSEFSVTVDPSTQTLIKERIEKRKTELAQLQSQNPQPVLWRSFETPKFGVGRNLRFGDLNGDGELDLLLGQNIRLTETNSATELSCLTAVTLKGEVLWQLGEPKTDLSNAVITCDTPMQIHDLDGDGAEDVIIALGRKLQVLDGRTGKVKHAVAVPEVTSYPAVPQKASKNWPTNISSGDCLVFADFAGTGHRDHIIMKDRYWNFWVFDKNLKEVWSGQGMLGHYPYAYHDQKSGKDQLAIGYALWNGAGKQLWSLDQDLHDHADSIAIGNFSGDPNEAPRCYYCGSDEGVIVADIRGFIEKQIRVGHAQTSTFGKFRSDLPGLQLVTVNFWKNPGIVSVFQHDGTLLQQEEPSHSGSPLMPVNWRGDGQEFILLGGNVQEGGLLDGQLRRVVMFPDDGHPDLCAASQNLTGDVRDEIVLWDNHKVCIYTQDQPFQGQKLYAPQRNPDANDSNYRCNISLPGWKESTAGK